jgi:hypothetical protein
LHRASLRVFLYTADANEQIKLARALGADGIISTSPNEYKVAYRENPLMRRGELCMIRLERVRLFYR